MSDLKNDRFIRALLKQSVDKTPIWMMRQAGRYLPEYREIRSQAGSFMNLCTNPELACEVTLQPLERFDFDAAILFSDILTIPDAMGLGLYFSEGEGPRFKNPVRSAADIEKLPIPDPELELKYVVDAVSLIRKNLQGRVPLIGFSGSPWTLATYMVEGGSSKTFSKVKGLMFEQPMLMHKMLDKLAQSVAAYLNAQIAAGAQAVMLFDTWGGALGTEEYLEFSLRYAEQVRSLLNTTQGGKQIPTVLFIKGGGQWLELMADIGYDALGLDWQTDIQQARARVGGRVALQGNMDPITLYANPDVIRTKVGTILEKYGSGSGHVFNLGHGILPDINPEHVKAMVDAVHDLSKPYHK
ncbi:uroporphyrinogen decarboxylase [Bathymodiolus platifrons methanotrophic gill symbiont]|uniref:uroporphyrinogen decarboxylase n=1 Tax=Bathymodiolus platifrons methanotrophic gill symbiont TaxID=113268 RepID=UPI000B417C95|nr:uroporphyrinogen decarboxylase [Bathymodiolus platifrons methanotrophic gill symbiont]MCK5869293.1 uroporphyrinogen decarboxylase [Methyloprofundus sp.]TXK95900.1 uroporphyrinogen decarboxylase [Methylococcaceae bacterium CS5]TXK96006.1 uroporphyrinogen decarboxylase [Methylococcaceae bacterium CS4]TXL05425.1 uroporphyrinogen decarboxylase [Methylococcaceae bacterium CS1]TXL05837.1 uroporphyrinogen decarboxylase [Methylococcaceae bacterium CS3]TXL10192.1 uroporphyrinogen decarboxylase [Met